MISFVEKRDGSTEQFDADKLNKWAAWASESCGVSWNAIVFDAIKTLHDGCKSTDIQTALINASIQRRDTGHSRMAARLFLGQIYKEAYGGFSVPSLKDFYDEMVTDGYWEDMGYSDDELDVLDDFIDHPADFSYDYATLRQFYDKYSISAYGRCLESPQMAMMGMAMSNMREEENRLEDVAKTYRYLSGLKINLPTPSLNGERAPMRGSPSCCLVSAKDTKDSLGAAIHVGYEMTAARAGIGAELTTRAPKDPVKNGTIDHGGKFNYYSFLDRSVKASTQLTRGGSATVTYTCLDPEIEYLLRLKSQRTPEDFRLEFMDYSLAMNNLFLQKAAKNEDWMLVSVYYAPTLYEKFYEGNPEDFKTEYDRVASSGVKKTFVSARKILMLAIQMRLETGRIYRTYIDNVNQHTPFKEKIRLSNLCVAPHTRILTDKGEKVIGELEGEHINVWNGEEWSGVEVLNTSPSEHIFKVRVEDPRGYESSLDCTPYHKWYLWNGDEVRTKDLRSGDVLLGWVDPDGRKQKHVVREVIDTNQQMPVFCFKEHKKGMGVFNGILTGQCQEVLLVTSGYDHMKDLYKYEETSGEIALCFLASIVQGNVSDDEYEDVAYIACKFVDNTIEKTLYPFESMAYSSERRRSIGIGMTDVAHWMALNNHMYDTEDGRNAIHRLAERHSYYLHKASVRLAQERGACEWMHKTKYADDRPWLPIDTYVKEIDKHHSQDLWYDWETVRDNIRHHGVRFSVLEAYMPVESSSVFTNSTNGVYPIRDSQMFKKSRKGMVFFQAPDWDTLKGRYQFAWDISMLDMAKVYAIIQKFTGQSISADFYADYTKGEPSMKEMMQLEFAAAKMGMKTMYYLNSKVGTSAYEDNMKIEEEPACDSCSL